MSFLWDIGDAVRVTSNVRNDGTFAGAQRGDLLIRRGRVGTVVDVGLFLQTQVIYTVHFLDDDRLVGCREEELIGADEAWVPSLYETRERVSAARTLALAGGALRIERGCGGEVLRVLRVLRAANAGYAEDGGHAVCGTHEGTSGVVYHVHFDSAPGRVLAVPEALLVGAAPPPGVVPDVADDLEDADNLDDRDHPAAGFQQSLPGGAS